MREMHHGRGQWIMILIRRETLSLPISLSVPDTDSPLSAQLSTLLCPLIVEPCVCVCVTINRWELESSRSARATVNAPLSPLTHSSMGFLSQWIDSHGGAWRDWTDCRGNSVCQISQYGEFIRWRLTLGGGLAHWSPVLQPPLKRPRGTA